ncbi:MAG: tRNA (adenosine(37)-N6)-threonylcarbamoyltransferase complex transferase subunit TsaD [Deltaproteobacteria bacterium]|nr:tRNA (adenosine(37)-N6)-threonylcarbamoyltransferase complex transferase subunit TsaD [Deltaproteobacteria bacterium]
MLTLGIETSCDDTAASVVRDGSYALSSVVSSQDDIHSKYGGIVPELASRRHIEMIIPVVDEALIRAGVALSDIDGLAVTEGPGLVGSILVGLNFAKSVAYAAKKPLAGVNHIAAHPLAAFLKETPEADVPDFPFVALIASGGHTTLVRYDGFADYAILGSTLDDAAGEAFDKVAKLLGLGFPGGAIIDGLAKAGDPRAFDFTRPYMGKTSLDFSFSGIKTAALEHVRAFKEELTPDAVSGIAASFQEAVVDVLVVKAIRALERTGSNRLVVAGGVACNSRLRLRLQEAATEADARLFMPAPRYCSDNAAMIAVMGFNQLQKGASASLDLNARPTWEGF